MKRRVVVLGAGYAGLPAAKRIARQVRADEVEVTLVNGTDEFVERPRLHQIAVGQDVGIVPLRKYLNGTPVRFVRAWATAIDLDCRTVTVTRGAGRTDTLLYDILVYALGSNIDIDSVAGVREHTFALTGNGAAAEFGARLQALQADGGTLVVCGGGLTGIEIAAEVAEAYRRLRVELLSEGHPGSWLSDKARAHLDEVLSKLGIGVIDNGHVDAAEHDRFILSDGRNVVFDAAAWAGGFRVPALASDAGLAVTAGGRARVGRDLRSLSHPDVYVVGDAAAVEGPWGEQLAMGCRTGGFTGPRAADAVVAALTGHGAKPFGFRYFHECISLGRRHGLVQFLNADETPKDRILTGRKAIAYKNFTLNGARMVFRRPGPALARRRRLADSEGQARIGAVRVGQL